MADSVPVYISGPVGGSGLPSGARAPEDLDAVAGGERDDGALGVLALAHPLPWLRLRLPWRLIVFTPRTFTLKICSTAILIWVLLASGSTMNVYWLLVEQAVALLRDDRGEQDVPGVADAHAFSSVVSSAARLGGRSLLGRRLLGRRPSSAGGLRGRQPSWPAPSWPAAFFAAAFFAGASAAVAVSTVPSPSAGRSRGRRPGCRGVVEVGQRARSALPLAGAGDVLGERGLGEDHLVGDQHVVGVELAGLDAGAPAARCAG